MNDRSREEDKVNYDIAEFKIHLTILCFEANSMNRFSCKLSKMTREGNRQFKRIQEETILT